MERKSLLESKSTYVKARKSSKWARDTDKREERQEIGRELVG
jgi:hypothetical protein